MLSELSFGASFFSLFLSSNFSGSFGFYDLFYLLSFEDSTGFFYFLNSSDDLALFITFCRSSEMFIKYLSPSSYFLEYFDLVSDLEDLALSSVGVI